MRAHRFATRHALTPREIHLLMCDCPTCEPYVPSVPRYRDSIAPTSIALAAGVAVGVAIAAAYDRFMPGLQVGLGAVFGW